MHTGWLDRMCGGLHTASHWLIKFGSWKEVRRYTNCLPGCDFQAMADRKRVVLIQITLTLQIWRPCSFVFIFLSTVPCSPNRNSSSCQSQIPTSCKHPVYLWYFENWGKRSRLPYSKAQIQRSEANEFRTSKYQILSLSFSYRRSSYSCQDSNPKWILRSSLFSVLPVTKEGQLLDHWWRIRHFVFGESLETSNPSAANCC